MRGLREYGLWRGLLCTLAIVAAPHGSGAEEIAVDVVNASTPTLCAEIDNVHVKLQGEAVRSFTIEAAHPAFMGMVVVDRSAPDFRNCDMSGDPAFRAEPRRVTLFETPDMQLIGHTFPSFWRDRQVPVRVGDRVETGLHLLQLWMRFEDRTEEVLVLYPADGYWRARPISPTRLRWTAYGSSFLIGPVENARRPLVDIAEISFDPATRSLHTTFVRGGGATVALAELDREHVVLDVTMDPPVAADHPFAALRSMFVTDTNADVGQLAWRDKGADGWQQSPVMSFTRGKAAELWAGRAVPSRHNLSAPDMTFRDFRSAVQ